MIDLFKDEINRRILFSFFTISTTLCSGLTHAGMMANADKPTKHWTGLYLGANAGGWWSSSTAGNTLGSPLYADPGAVPGSVNVESMLVNIGTKKLSIDTNGFIGGGQIGFNYELKRQFIVGLDADMDGITQSTTAASLDNVLISGARTYNSTVAVTKNINYLGTLRGRLGMLLRPTLLLYGTGGLGYGHVSFSTSIAAAEQTAPNAFPALSSQAQFSRTLTGWTAGGGGEWMFRPNWSAKIEYLYYDLGTLDNSLVLTQMQILIPPPAIYAQANVNSSTRFAQSAVRMSLNYHFS